MTSSVWRRVVNQIREDFPLFKMSRTRTLLGIGVMSAFAVIAVACGSDEPAAESTATTTAVQPTSTAVPPTAEPTIEPTTEPHDHSSHAHGPVDSPGMAVDLEVEIDAVSGVNVQIIPTGFYFTPESVNADHVDGEGHAHVYVNGVKLGRVYTEWIHLPGLEPGEHNIAVTLNANTHADYTSNGLPVIATKAVTVPEPDDHHGQGHSGHAAGIETATSMSVQISAEPDSVSGANVFITVDGFEFSPKDVNEDHVDGEGHAHVYVDGEKIGRVYGSAIHLGHLSEGMHEIRVALNANTHEDYLIDGEVVEAVATVHVEKGGDSSDDHDHGHGDNGHDAHDDKMEHGDDGHMKDHEGTPMPGNG